MPAVAAFVPTRYQPGSPRERATASVLSALIIVLGLLLALYQTGFVAVPMRPRGITTFNAAPEGAESSHARSKAHQPRASAGSRPNVATKPRPRVIIPIPRRRETELAGVPGFIHLSHDELAAGDIGAMHGPAGHASDGEGKATYGPGEGPGGLHLYYADWYREPTDAELAGYLPKAAPRDGYGTIACQTIEHYHVDNCRIVDESPRGSGFGRAVLNAAWQFLVIPPRIDSRPQVGAWVRIRITYTERGIGVG